MKVRLKDLGTIFTGNTPSKRVDEYWDNSDIKFIKPDIIKDELCVISSANEYISAGAKNASRIVPANSVLVTCIGNIGRVGITEEEVAFNQQINAIVPNRTIIPKYLAYAIYANRKQLQAIANAPVVPIINKTQFSDFEISICESLEKQNKIVRILDTISEIITHNKKKIEALDDLIKARFVEMFGNYKMEKTIGEVATICRGASPRPISKFITESNGENWIKIGDVKEDDTFITKTKELVTEDGANRSRRIKPGDFILSNSMSFGRPYISKIYGCVHDGWLIISDYEQSFLPLFFYYAIRSELVQAQFRKSVAGAVVKNLNSDLVRSVKIVIPSIESQEKFASFVAQVDKSKFAVQKSLEKTQLLFNSLMQEYFG